MTNEVQIRFKGHTISRHENGICSVTIDGETHKFRFIQLAKDFIINKVNGF